MLNTLHLLQFIMLDDIESKLYVKFQEKTEVWIIDLMKYYYYRHINLTSDI